MMDHGGARCAARRDAGLLASTSSGTALRIRSHPPTTPLQPFLLRARTPPHCRTGAGRAAAAAAADTTTTTNGNAPTPSPPQWEDEPDGLWWSWERVGRIYYKQRGDSGPPLLFIHGFGVGAFHFEAQLEALSARGCRVYAIDLLGQGRSWPDTPTPTSPLAAVNTASSSSSSGGGGNGNGNSTAAGAGDAQQQQQQQRGKQRGLAYCAETWTQQLADFLEQVVGEPAYVAGNSLGGYLSANLAATRPELVRGVALLNATPFWSFAPNPRANPTLARLMPWDGSLPAPAPLRRAVDIYWQRFTAPATVRGLLGLVYADPSRADAALVERILEATAHPAALDAFTSIVFAPRTQRTFDEMLRGIRCPIALVYGKEDPWVVPLWGQRAKRALPDAAYFEISPSGHSPHHETPEAANAALALWLDACEATLATSSASASSSCDGDGSSGGSGAPGTSASGSRDEGICGSVLRSVLDSIDADSDEDDIGSSSNSGASQTGASSGGSGSGSSDGSSIEGARERLVWEEGGVRVVLVDGSPRNVFERADAVLAKLLQGAQR